ncbi:MAG TPA: hypothetical protein VFB52_08260, partial [Solirubrobacterales bacterium]|nr:hypothetical protein [Solirubrobacterales bacterium]
MALDRGGALSGIPAKFRSLGNKINGGEMISSSPPKRSWLRLLAVGLGVVLIAALLAACGGSDSDSTSSGS